MDNLEKEDWYFLRKYLLTVFGLCFSVIVFSNLNISIGFYVSIVVLIAYIIVFKEKLFSIVRKIDGKEDINKDD